MKIKRFFLTFFFLTNIFLFPFFSVFSAGPGPRPNLVPTIPFAVPGLNCGYAGIVGKDSCCVTENPEIEIPAPTSWGTIFGKMVGLIPFNVVGDLIKKFTDEKRASLGLIGISCQ